MCVVKVDARGGQGVIKSVIGKATSLALISHKHFSVFYRAGEAAHAAPSRRGYGLYDLFIRSVEQVQKMKVMGREVCCLISPCYGDKASFLFAFLKLKSHRHFLHGPFRGSRSISLWCHDIVFDVGGAELFLQSFCF